MGPRTGAFGRVPGEMPSVELGLGELEVQVVELEGQVAEVEEHVAKSEADVVEDQAELLLCSVSSCSRQHYPVGQGEKVTGVTGRSVGLESGMNDAFPWLGYLGAWGEAVRQKKSDLGAAVFAL